MRGAIYSSGIALLLCRRGATRISVACFRTRYSTVSSDCTEETICLPIGNNGAISLKITRPSALSRSHQGLSPEGPNVILYLPAGPLLLQNGTSTSQKYENIEVDHRRTGDTITLASATCSPQQVLASTASALVVTVNYRLGEMQTHIPPSTDKSSISQEPIEAPDQPLGSSNPQLTSYKYPTPVHDTLAGFDWIQTHLRPSKLAIFGTHVGGSLALMLALTEAQSVRAVAAVDPICDWPGLDEYCTRESTIPTRKTEAGDNTTLSSTKPSKHKRQPRKKNPPPPDLVPLLQARSEFFLTPERCFDSFASPILFLRSAGRDVPRRFSQYLTGPEYPVPVLKETRSTTAAEQYASSDESIWDRDMYPDMDADDVDVIGATVTRRRKALSRWPPYGLDYGLRGNTWSGPGDGIGRLQMALPWIRVFTREDGAGLAACSLSSSIEMKKKTREGFHGSTVLARQADEMVSAMRRACFWGREKGVGERRVTLSLLQSTGNNAGEEVGDWFKNVFQGTMEID